MPLHSLNPAFCHFSPWHHLCSNQPCELQEPILAPLLNPARSSSLLTGKKVPRLLLVSKASWSPTHFIILQPLWLLCCSSKELISFPVQATCPSSPHCPDMECSSLGSFHGWFPPFVKASNQIPHSQRGTIFKSNILVTLYPFIQLYFPHDTCHSLLDLWVSYCHATNHPRLSGLTIPLLCS